MFKWFRKLYLMWKNPYKVARKDRLCGCGELWIYAGDIRYCNDCEVHQSFCFLHTKNNEWKVSWKTYYIKGKWIDDA